MKTREFGKTGMIVSEIGFGGSRIGGFFAGRHGSKEALHVLSGALDSGITFYDTADIYAQGESEVLIGKAFRGRRDEVVLATKGGYCLPAQRNLLKRIKPLVRPIVKTLGLRRAKLPSGIAGSLSQDFSPSYLTRTLEASLKRLRTDYVDLYQLHSPPAPFLQGSAFGEAIETLEKLKGQGKIRFYGVATEIAEEAPFCLSASASGISSVQLGFGVLDLEALEQGTLPAAAARGLGVIARGCFGGGLLKDGLDEAQLKTATSKWQRILALRSFSKASGRPPLEIALQFCRGTPAISVTLLGMHTQRHLQENLRYLQRAPLTSEEYTTLSHRFGRQGEEYQMDA
jgi:aryl-alcohol dehydrogenase-like predicted oxidoreductase